ncbi:hypothetical protein J3E69DRAFT_344786 [Trichoderma sp. SZMC 28015]
MFLFFLFVSFLLCCSTLLVTWQKEKKKRKKLCSDQITVMLVLTGPHHHTVTTCSLTSNAEAPRRPSDIFRPCAPDFRPMKHEIWLQPSNRQAGARPQRGMEGGCTQTTGPV